MHLCPILYIWSISYTNNHTTILNKIRNLSDFFSPNCCFRRTFWKCKNVIKKVPDQSSMTDNYPVCVRNIYFLYSNFFDSSSNRDSPSDRWDRLQPSTSCPIPKQPLTDLYLNYQVFSSNFSLTSSAHNCEAPEYSGNVTFGSITSLVSQ